MADWAALEEEEGMSKVALPSDMWFEVLTRMEMKSLASAGSACRAWNSLYYDPCVVRLHSDRTSTVRGCFMQGCHPHYKCNFIPLQSSAAAMETPRLSLKFLPEKPVQIEASTPSGLLCCVGRQYGRQCYFVCKPTTKEWVELPKPKLRFFTLDIGMVVLATRPLHYKLVRLSRENNVVTYTKCEIFDSREWKWRTLGDIRLEYECLVLPLRQGVVVNGVYHCLSVDSDRSRILAFDISTERWRLMELPDQGLQVQQKRLVSLRGKPALVSKGDDECEDVWMLSSHSSQKWDREETTRTSLMGKLKDCDQSAGWLHFFQSDVVPLNIYQK